MTPAASHALTPSSRRHPCPICGRNEDGDCRISDTLVLCHRGGSFSPPDGIKKGEKVTGKNGLIWAYAGESSDGRCATFVIHEEKGPQERSKPLRSVQLASSPLTDPQRSSRLPKEVRLSSLLSSPPQDLATPPWWYSERQVTAREGNAKGKPYHLDPEGNWVDRAGPSPWPLYGLGYLQDRTDGWLLELEGEKCAAVAISRFGLAAVSQPGHNHKTDAILSRYLALKESGAEGVVYVADNDETGVKKGQKCRECASEAGLPFLLLRAEEVWPGMPKGGSIDDVADVDRALVLQQLSAAIGAACLSDGVEEDDDGKNEAERVDLDRLLSSEDQTLCLADILPASLAGQLALRAASFPIDEKALLLPLLCATASVIGNRAEVLVKDGWAEPFVLWGANVSNASDMKTPAAAVYSKPLGKWQAQLHKADKLQKDVWAMQRNAAKAKGLSKEDLAAWEIENPAPPPTRELFVQDATLEAVSRISGSARYFGLLSFCDELAAWFSALRRGQSAMDQRPNWLSLWAGGVLKVDRATVEPIFVANTAHSIFGNLTRSRFSELLAADQQSNDRASGGKDQDGMAARFLLMSVENPVWQFNDICADVTDQILDLWQWIDSRLCPRSEDGQPVSFQFDPEARAVLMAFCNQIAVEARENSSSDRAQWLGKLRGSSVRMAGTLHALSEAVEGESLSTMVEMGSVEKTIRLSRHLISQYDALHAEAGSGSGALPAAVASLAVRGAKWRREKGKEPVTLAKLRDWSLPSRNATAKERREWLEMVCETYPQIGLAEKNGGRSVVFLPAYSDQKQSDQWQRVIAEQGG